MSMPRAVRHINETRALAALLKRGPMSRADLARYLGITRATASSIISTLTRAGYVEDEPEPDVERRKRTGRPSTLVSLRPEHAIFLGADIAVDRVSFAAIDMRSNIIVLEKSDFDCTKEGYISVSRFVSSGIMRIVSRLSSPQAVKGLCITVPGLVDFGGTVIRAPLLGWKDIPLKKAIQRLLPGINVTTLENDANAFAVENIQSGNRSDKLDAVYVFIDAGVGGCIISNGNILRGHDGYAGEIGHIIVGEEGFSPQRSIKGSLESFISRPALLSRHRFYGGNARSMDEFISLLKDNETAARSALSDWAYFLGRGLATLISILNPERIIFGGDVASVLSFAEADVQASIRQHLLESAHKTIIEISSIGTEAPAIGAALMQHREFFSLDNEILFGASPD